MATVVISDITLCPGGQHITLTGTLDGQARTVRTNRDRLLSAHAELDIEDRLVARLYSAVKEAGATTNLQIRTAIVGKAFEV